MCVPTCLTAFLDGKGYGKLATGDKGGAVTLWDADALVAGAKGLARGKRPAGGTEGARVFRLPKAHTDWVTQLTFTTSLFSGALLSSAMEATAVVGPAACVPELPGTEQQVYVRHVSSTEGVAAVAATVVRNSATLLKARITAFSSFSLSWLPFSHVPLD